MGNRYLGVALVLLVHAGASLGQETPGPAAEIAAPPDELLPPLAAPVRSPGGAVPIDPAGPLPPASRPYYSPGGGSYAGPASLLPMPAMGGPVDGGPAPGAHLPEGAWQRPNTGSCCWWVTPEYLLWQVKRGPVSAPLVATGSLDDSTASTLFGASGIGYHSFSGGRLAAGAWLDQYGTVGVEGRGLLLASNTTRATFSSNANGQPRLGVPFINADTGQEDFADFATPGQTVGKIDVSSSSRLWGAESNLIFNLFRDQHLLIEALGGFRYLGLREDLRLTGSTSPLAGQEVVFGGGSFGPPTVTTTADRFLARSNFYGGQLGARTQVRWGNAFVDLTGKLALGDTHETVNISGSSSLLAGPGAPLRTLPGGVLALPSNIGRSSSDDFTVVPELEVKLGYQFGKHVSAFVGYNFLYWSRVVRPGQQIDRALVPGQVPTFVEFVPGQQAGPPSPVFSKTDFWAQGVSFGMELSF